MDGEHSLTSFRRLSPDALTSGFSFSRFFQRGKRDDVTGDSKAVAPVVSDGGIPRSSQGVLPSRPTTSYSQQLPKPPELPARGRWSPVGGRRAPSTPPQRAPPSGYRNLTAVLRRLSTVAHRRGQLPQAYKESDFKQYWMPDENCKECYECGEKFSTFRRRHHCRLCGQIFCYRCCYLEIPGQLMGYTGLLRVCTYCHKIVCTYTQSPDIIRNLEQLQMDLRVMGGDGDSTGNTSTKPYNPHPEDDDSFFETLSNRKVSGGSVTSGYPPCYERMEREHTSPVVQRGSTFPFDAFGVCAAEADILKLDSLRELWCDVMSPRGGLELQSHRFRLKTCHNCLVASELINWLLSHEKATNRNQAVVIGQAMLNCGLLEPVPIHAREGAVFSDEYALYQPGPAAPRDVPNRRSPPTRTNSVDETGSCSDSADVPADDETLPQWFRQLSEYESSMEVESQAASCQPGLAGPESVAAAPNKAQVAKLLNLDLANGTVTDKNNSEMSLQVDLDHFGEDRFKDSIAQHKASVLPLITDAPPPPLEQYVYSEGYPQMPLKLGNKKLGGDVEPAISADEIFSGAVIARKIGVDRPASPVPSPLREDNGERIAAERLAAACSRHLAGTLHQLLTDAGLSLDWGDVILPLVNRISEMVVPNVSEGDDMDIRQYVKFKKISGGKKSDCQLVSGVVFTKHVANKKMASAVQHPRVLVLSCAIDYQRNETRLASLDPLVLQEHKFLKIFVARVAALRPNVLLVEKTVSRLAQEMLLQHGITLVLNVKREVIERVARCTRADVLRSMEKLSQPTLGHCESFRVHKFTLKNGDCKTLMYFDGCPPELGCTVTLRGGNALILAKVKRVMRYLVYVAYSLRLETHFLMDEFALPREPEPKDQAIPKDADGNSGHDDSSTKTSDGGSGHDDGSTKTSDGVSGHDDSSTKTSDGGSGHGDSSAKTSEGRSGKGGVSSLDESEAKVADGAVDSGSGQGETKAETSDERSIKDRTSLEETGAAEEASEDERVVAFQTALRRTFLSSSPYLKYPLPYLLTREGRGSVVRFALPRTIYYSPRLEPGLPTRPLSEEYLEGLDATPATQRKFSKDVHVLEPHPFVQASLTLHCSTNTVQALLADFRAQGGTLQLARKGLVPGRAVCSWIEGLEQVERKTKNRKNLLSRRSQPAKPAAKQESQGGQESKGFAPAALSHSTGQKTDCLDPQFHQRIAVLFSSYSSESNNSPRPCISPWAVFMEFYGRNDITLGGFLERYCFRPSYICPSPNCDVPMVNHVRYFAHGAGSVYIHMKNLESPIPGFQHTILTWSWCKECKQVTPIVPLSARAWALSFAKYLELRFYAADHTRRASVQPCGHSLHRDHYQYFAFANMVASFKYRPIKLFETAIPPAVIHVNQEQRDPRFWTQDAIAMATRGEQVFSSLLERLESLKPEPASAERDAKVSQFLALFNEERKRFEEQVMAVEKKAAGLQAPQNPLAVPEKGDSARELDDGERRALQYVIADSLNSLKRNLCEVVENWNNRLQEFMNQEKKKTNKGLLNRDGKPTAPLNIEARCKDQVDGIDFKSSHYSPVNTPPLGSRPPSPYPAKAGNQSESSISRVGLGRASDTAPGDSTEGLEARLPLTGSDEATEVEETGDPEGDAERKRPGKESEIWVQAQLSGGTDKAGEVRQGTEESSELDRQVEAKSIPGSRASPEVGETEAVALSQTCGSLSGFVLVDRHHGNPARRFVPGHRRAASSPLLCDEWRAGVDDHVDVSRALLKRARSWSDASNSSRDQQDAAPLTSVPGSIGERQQGHVAEPRVVSGIDRLRKSLSVPGVPGKGPGSPEAEAAGGTGTEAGSIKRRDKVKNMISSLLPGSAYQPVDSTFPCHEHHLLPSGEKVVVVVSEKEPTSIISYCLSTKQYTEHLHEIQQHIRDVISGAEVSSEASKAFPSGNKSRPPPEMPTSQHVIKTHESSSPEDYVTVDLAEPRSDEDTLSLNSEHLEFMRGGRESRAETREGTYTHVDTVRFSKHVVDEVGEETDGRRRDDSPLQRDPSLARFGFQKKEEKPGVDYHIKLQFSDNSTRFLCNVFFAEQFRSLRKRIFAESEERYIRSLQRCVVWRARGGKSGSAFSKSLDDRFVIKQMSRLELVSFLEFAPHYFQYVNKALDEKRPTLLAKILGVYRIGFRNSQTNATMRQDVLVMENLFYDRKIDKIFDLKGSMRSRYVQSSGAQNDVLLDENLLELIRECPIFIRPHSKTVFSRSIHNDTEFLSRQMVMDYSLLVGIDEARGELVLGVIDFIRTFTWDKKLEMYVKSSGILGGQGKMPTVVSPELYRTRFTEAMHRYFLMVPDKWTGLGSDLV